MEVALRRRLVGVARVSISQAQQTAEVEFLPTPHSFSTDAFREAVGEADVEVVGFEVDVCGVVVQQAERRWLTAGADQFLLAGGNSVVGQHVCATGRLTEGSDRSHLVIENVQIIR